MKKTTILVVAAGVALYVLAANAALSGLGGLADGVAIVLAQIAALL